MDIASRKICYLTPNEAANRLMVSPVTLRHWALAGKLAFVTTPGGHRRFAEEEVERFAAQHGNATGMVDHDPERILIVDDDVQLTGLLEELLQGLPDPVQTTVANDGFEAGQKLMVFRPHTVLLDITMPGIQGFDVCRKIKNNPETRDTQVVVMANQYTPENRQQALDAGAETCLAKPLDEIQLLKALTFGGTGTRLTQV